MITSFSIYQKFQAFVNTFQGGWYRPYSDFIQMLNSISNQVWEELTAMADKSEEIKDNLSPFLISKNIIVKSVDSYYGFLAFPATYGRFATATVLVAPDETCCPSKEADGFQSQEQITDEYYDSLKEYEVMEVDQQKWGACLTHLTKAPTLTSPKITRTTNGFKVAPRKVSVIVFNYYRKPIDAEFKYTVASPNVQTGAGDQIIYDTSSKPLEWPETMVDEFVIRLGERYGLYTRDQFVSGFSGQLKQAS